MRELQPLEFSSFTIKQLSEDTSLATSTILYRCKELRLKPIRFEGKHQYLINSIDAERIIAFRRTKRLKLPEVIYVVRTTEIYESKLNYLELSQH